MKKIVMFFVILSLAVLLCADTNSLHVVRQRLDTVMSYCASNRLDYCSMDEAMNFEWFQTNGVYNSFSVTISNDLANVLAKFSEIATNSLERLLVLGVGKHFDEDFYIAFIDALSGMRTNKVISAREFSWAQTSARFDLMSCFIRRYQEPRVRVVIEKLSVAEPNHSNHWNKVLSGVAYTNYLEEVEIGLWQ